MVKNKQIMKSLLTSAAISIFALATPPTFAISDGDKPVPVKEKVKAVDEEKAEVDNTQDKPEKEKKKKEKKKDKTLAEAIKDQTAFNGLFKIYQDPKTGKISMEIREDQLDKEFIYVSHITNGIVEGGHFRGQYRQDIVLRFHKHFNSIELIQENTNFSFDENKAIARAKNANISPSVMSVQKIKATAKDKKSYLINVDRLFKGRALDPVKGTPNPKQKPWESFRLGKLDSSKTKITSIKNFPKNTAINVDFVFSNPAPLNMGEGFEITDPRNISVSMQHSFIEMPIDNGFKPRVDDARIGYFLNYINDMTDSSATPWVDVITRWNLIKKDPNAAISQPIEPIVFWIENTTPIEFRDTIKRAGEAWNIAFEAAGFKNAVVIKTQSDDADWDADDIRYNVLRWTSSPQPPFGGYGPSFVNPRTGQILGADIMLEVSFLTNRLNMNRAFEKSGLETANQQASAYIGKISNHMQHCNLAGQMQMNTMLGRTLASIQGRSSEDQKMLIEESIYYLLLHEIGHTLGLNHNMKATTTRSFDTAHDIDAQNDGLAGSVMDYPSINFAPAGKKQAHYYTVRPGSYDMWAINFGYNPDMDDADKREALLARSNEAGLAFGNDADDMRSPGKGIDPRINIYDMTDDPIAYATERMGMDRKALSELKDRFVTNGDSYQALRNAYLVITNDMAWQGRVVSRYIGGVYVNRSIAGQKGAKAPYRPVEAAKQKEAMQMLRDQIFAPTAFEAEGQLISHLAIQRRGFRHFGKNEDPKIHARAFKIQTEIISQVLHPNTLNRITDSSLYGNNYDVASVLNDLTAAIFEADIRHNVNAFRQNLQVSYVKNLIKILSSKKHNYVSQSAALFSLKSIRQDVERARTRDISTRAHREHIKLLIDKTLQIAT